MVKKLLWWIFPLWSDWWFGSPVRKTNCDSMDAVRQTALELLDGLDSAAAQGVETGDANRMQQLDSLAGYVEGELQKFRTRHFPV